MAVRYYLSPNADKKGEHPIRVSISIKGTRLVSTAGFNVKPSRWDSDTQTVKAKTTTAKGETEKDINNKLKQISSYFDLYESKLKRKPTSAELADILAEQKGSTRKRPPRERPEDVKMSVLDYFDEFYRFCSVPQPDRKRPWADGSRECWAAFRRHLKNQGDIDFDFFDEEGMKKFVEYLRHSDESLGKVEMEEKTVRKHFSNLKCFLQWCIDKGHCKESQISRYKPGFGDEVKPVIFLEKDELLKLYNYEVPANGTKVVLTDANGETYEKTVHDAAALEKTRDFFCFCAFTSLRYSDAAKLKRSDIVGNKIKIITKKTKDYLEIDLISYARKILDKYADAHLPFDLALPIISNQRMNDYIKDLGELCGFNERKTRIAVRGGKEVTETYRKWELLGTHAARRTFICFAISIGIPAAVIMKWTGHSDYKTLQIYIDAADKTKTAEMHKIDEQLQL